MTITITDEERRNLESLEGKLSVIRDAVRGVVSEFHTGFILHGEGGSGKSYTVLNELQRLQADYVYHNTRMTGRGLVNALQRAPSGIHLIEDAETLLDDRNAWGVLRSALHSQSAEKPARREITWTASRTNIRFPFTGGIIVVSNRDLGDTKPEIRSLKTRVGSYRLDISNEEMRALMKNICMSGYTYGEHHMTPEECWEVASVIISTLESLHRSIDLRQLVSGFRDYLQYKAGQAENHWRTLLEGRLQPRAIYRRRAEQKAQEACVALEIDRLKLAINEKVQLWHERTGLAQAAYYRALKR